MRDQLQDAKDVTYGYDLVDAGRNMDGGTQVAHRYFIEAETPDGFRFRLQRTFCSARTEVDADGWQTFVQDVARDEALAAEVVARIVVHLASGGALDPHHWYAIQGAYGSAGWDELAELELEYAEAR